MDKQITPYDEWLLCNGEIFFNWELYLFKAYQAMPYPEQKLLAAAFPDLFIFKN